MREEDLKEIESRVTLGIYNNDALLTLIRKDVPELIAEVRKLVERNQALVALNAKRHEQIGQLKREVIHGNELRP